MSPRPKRSVWSVQPQARGSSFFLQGVAVLGRQKRPGARPYFQLKRSAPWFADVRSNPCDLQTRTYAHTSGAPSYTGVGDKVTNVSTNWPEVAELGVKAMMDGAADALVPIRPLTADTVRPAHL